MKLLKIFILVFIFAVIIATPIILYILLTKPKYKCDTTTGSCTKDSSGKYNSLNDCNNNCNKPSPTITFTFEDGKTETFPYNIKNKYYTSRGILSKCPTNYPPPTDGKSFSMKNSGLPTKYTVSNFPSSERIVMTGFSGATGGNFCDTGVWAISPGQDLRKLDPNNPSGSQWVWKNAMQTFRGDVKK